MLRLFFPHAPGWCFGTGMSPGGGGAIASQFCGPLGVFTVWLVGARFGRLHCPAAHLFFGHAVPPIVWASAEGLRHSENIEKHPARERVISALCYHGEGRERLKVERLGEEVFFRGNKSWCTQAIGRRRTIMFLGVFFSLRHSSSILLTQSACVGPHCPALLVCIMHAAGSVVFRLCFTHNFSSAQARKMLFFDASF